MLMRVRSCSSLRGAQATTRRRSLRELESAEASLRVGGSNPGFGYGKVWIASWSLSSGAHSRDPLARNDAKGIAGSCRVMAESGIDWLFEKPNV
jgi:hypothetical protein